MARKKINELTEILIGDVDFSADEIALNDSSALGARRIAIGNADRYRATPIILPSGGTLTNSQRGVPIRTTGQSSNSTFNLPAGSAGQPFIFHFDNDTYTNAIDPNAAELIDIGSVLTAVTRGWLTINWAGSRWEILHATCAYEVA
jgi:hypothetical protein